MKQYDYLLVGSGLFAGVFAYFAGKQGKKCLVLEKRDHLGGNIYCEETEGIHVHKYGAHIFHTSNREVWDFVNSLAEFNRYTNSPVANYKGEMYNMPFNMNTFSRMWGISTPEEAKKIIQEQRKVIKGEPQNLEEQAINLVVNLEQWNDQVFYDRLGTNEEFTTILDMKVPSITIPIKPGRNLAIIIEETIRQRYQGVKNEAGVWITPAFPKLIYVLEEDNFEQMMLDSQLDAADDYDEYESLHSDEEETD